MSKAKNQTPKDPGNEFAAFVCDAGVTESLVPILAQNGWSLESVSMGGIENAIRSLGASPSPRFLLVDLSDSIDPRGDINALAEVCEPGTSVISIGALNDVALYRDLIDAGIVDYFVKPVTPDNIRTAILSAEQMMNAPAETAPQADADAHRAISVIGSRGGVGSSLIASSMAWLSAHRFNKPTALLDLDIHFGTAALCYDLEPSRGLIDALDNPGRVDSLFVERAVIKESENLAILSAEASLSEATQADPAALAHLVEELRTKYDLLIIDLPRHAVAQHPYILAESSDVVIVTDFSLAGTRDTIRLLNFVKDHAPTANLKVIVNGLGNHGPVEVDQRDFEASIERKIDWTVPFDPKSVIAAAKLAKPLGQAAPSSKIVGTLKTITESFIGTNEKVKQGSFWTRVVGKTQK